MKTARLIVSATLLTTVLAACASIHQSKSSAGANLFEVHCQQCHHYADDLKEPKDFLKQTVHFGGEQMPAFKGILTPAQEEELVAYLASL